MSDYLDRIRPLVLEAVAGKVGPALSRLSVNLILDPGTALKKFEGEILESYGIYRTLSAAIDGRPFDGVLPPSLKSIPRVDWDSIDFIGLVEKAALGELRKSVQKDGDGNWNDVSDRLTKAVNSLRAASEEALTFLKNNQPVV